MGDLQADIFNKELKWEELESLPVHRTAHTAVLLGGNVYVGQGLEGHSVKDGDYCYRVDVYNLTTNQWSSSPITTSYGLFAMTVMDDKLVTAGGVTRNQEAVNNVLFLDAGKWKDYSEMPTARLVATAVAYHSMLIVVGGANMMEGKWTEISTTEIMDTTNGFWYTSNNLPSPHQRMKAVIMNDKLYLLGGENFQLSPQVFFASLDTLSTHQLNWQSAPNTPFCYSAPVVMYNKFLLTIGGRQPFDQTSQTCEVHILNTSTGQWKHLTNIPAARSLPAVVSIDDKIIVIGGMTSKNKEYSKTVWIGVFE